MQTIDVVLSLIWVAMSIGGVWLYFSHHDSPRSDVDTPPFLLDLFAVALILVLSFFATGMMALAIVEFPASLPFIAAAAGVLAITWLFRRIYRIK